MIECNRSLCLHGSARLIAESNHIVGDDVGAVNS